MGLDMYLFRDTYVGANFKHNKITGSINIKANGKKIPVKFNRISSIREEIMYWRKAYPIHQWFIDKLNYGRDDGEKYYVSREDLKELLDVCNEINDNPNKVSELMPNEDGYTEWFFEDIRETSKILIDILNEEDYGDFYYEASW